MKKILSKKILFSIVSCTIIPSTIAYAGFDITGDETNGYILTGKDNASFTDYKSSEHGGMTLDKFKEIHINVTDKPGLKTYSGRYDLSNTDLYITVNGNTENTDGIHLTNWNPHIVLNKYTANINAPKSDALNLSHDATSAYATINDLEAYVQKAHGIRANANLRENNINTITINNSAKITTAGNGSAAVYAGDSQRYFLFWGSETKGQGQIFLNGNTIIKNDGDGSYGVYAGKNGNISVNDLYIENTGKDGYGIVAKNDNLIYGSFDGSANRYGSSVALHGDDNTIIMSEDGKALYADSEYGKIVSGEFVSGDESNGYIGHIEDGTIGSLNVVGLVEANNKGVIDLTTEAHNNDDGQGVINIVSVNKVQDKNENVFGSEVVLLSHNNANINFDTQKNNEIIGAVKATDKGNIILSSSEGSNNIVSAANIADSGDKVISAIYGKDSNIDITASENGRNIIATYTGNSSQSTFADDDTESERTVWAQHGAVVDITGATTIISDNAENYYENGYATNSKGIAITAGSSDKSYQSTPDHRSTVNLKYSHDSYIYGDIVSGYGGDINIEQLNTQSKNGENNNLHVQGNILAGNGGTLDIDFGTNGTWYGRADDYQDAGSDHGAGGENAFFNPAFSNKIEEAGTVNITMGNGSKWSLTGQSWVSNLNATNTIIDMTFTNIKNEQEGIIDKNSSTHALTIGKLEGYGNTFIIGLNNENITQSDMLYIKEGNTEVDVKVVGTIEGIESVNEQNALRFATVGKGITLKVDEAGDSVVQARDGGMFNTNLIVRTDGDYDHTDKDNDKFNGGKDLTEDKPGTNSVNELFKDTEANNWEIIGQKQTGLSDAGKTVLDLSKVNYSNAVYMDRFNKRMGEARFIDGDEGIWVRLRHDRIGKGNAFRSMNTMYEIGYDVKQTKDNGDHRIGFAMDYMDGSSNFSEVNGKGEVSRKGLWMYDSWLGEKGHYRDFVAKWGHLSNDFEFASAAGEAKGDFSNNVYSISAEFGKKNDIGNNWYFEPQVQLQYAYVTDAEYKTTMAGKDQIDVRNDAFDSLIARAGFRLGRDLNNSTTVYIKGDVMHEFLGDQDVYAKDGTTGGKWANVNYDNSGTWCDLGFGFATKLNKTSYAYLDFEKSFGNDNEETYQINAGLQWSF